MSARDYSGIPPSDKGDFSPIYSHGEAQIILTVDTGRIIGGKRETWQEEVLTPFKNIAWLKDFMLEATYDLSLRFGKRAAFSRVDLVQTLATGTEERQTITYTVRASLDAAPYVTVDEQTTAADFAALALEDVRRLRIPAHCAVCGEPFRSKMDSFWATCEPCRAFATNTTRARVIGRFNRFLGVKTYPFRDALLNLIDEIKENKKNGNDEETLR